MPGGGQSREATSGSAAAGHAAPSICPSCYATSGPSLSALLAMSTTAGLREESGRRRLKGQGPIGRGLSNRAPGKRSGRGLSRESPDLSAPFIGAAVTGVGRTRTATADGVSGETRGGISRVPETFIAGISACGATTRRRRGCAGRPSMFANGGGDAASAGRRAAFIKRDAERPVILTAGMTTSGKARLAVPFGPTSTRARQRRVISL